MTRRCDWAYAPCRRGATPATDVCWWTRDGEPAGPAGHFFCAPAGRLETLPGGRALDRASRREADAFLGRRRVDEMRKAALFFDAMVTLACWPARVLASHRSELVRKMARRGLVEDWNPDNQGRAPARGRR